MLLGLTAVAALADTKTFDVREFGAKGDGKTLDTAAIQKALDQCGGSGGGIVRFAAGTYLSQPLTLRSRTTVQLDEGATLKATDDPKDYLPVDVTWDEVLSGAKRGPFANFINGKDLEDVTLTGKGTIDGSGEFWWGPAEEARRKVSGYTLPRPNLIRVGAKNFTVTDVTIQNSPKFHLVPDDCENVFISGVKILAPEGAANTDAIDPSVCKNVVITNCYIDVGDDNVAVKSGKAMPGREFGCENLFVVDCTFKHGHGMSIGSETVGGVKNLTMRNCTFENTDNGIRIKSYRGKGGLVENFLCENVTMTNVQGAITITTYYPRIPKTNEPPQAVTSETPRFKNITIRNLTATSTKAAGVIVGLPESPIENVLLENVQIAAQSTGLLIRNAKGVQLKNVNVTAKDGPPIIVQDAEVEGLPNEQE